MRVLLVKPMEHPQIVDIKNSLGAMYDALDCGTITAAYPWEEPLALVTDDEGLYRNKPPNRYIREMRQPILGSFFLCGIGREDFTDLPEELAGKYMGRFWVPEMIFMAGGRLAVVRLDDGTEPG